MTRTAWAPFVKQAAKGNPKLPRRLQLAAVFVPVLLTAWFVFHFTVELPFQDAWNMVPMVRHMQEGGLQWADIYRIHNGNRVATYQAIALLLAKATRYNVLAEFYLSYGCLAASVMVLYAFFVRLQKTTPAPTIAFLPVVILYLNWRGNEAMMGGICLDNQLEPMFFLLAIWCCLQVPERGRFLAPAIAFAVLGTFSETQGLMSWPIGLAILLFHREHHIGRQIQIWFAATIVCVAVYFYNYTTFEVPWPNGIGYVLQNKHDAGVYSFIYAGSALGATPSQAAWCGIALTVLLLPVAWYILRDRETWSALLPFAAVFLSTALLLGPLLSNRLGLGVEQAFGATRYMQMEAWWPIFAYIAILVLSYRYRIWRWILRLAVLVLCACTYASYSAGVRLARDVHSRQVACQAVLRNFRSESDQAVTCYFPDPSLGRRWAFDLEQLHLSVFRNEK
jgi:hypothetical protein